MPDDDTLDEGGLEPTVDEAPVDDAAVEVEEAPEPETYTREQLTELLGPRFAERFAGAHEGEEALRQFGQAFDNTLSLVGRGAHLEPQDEEFYRNLGLEPPAPPVEEPEEEVPGLWGSPWQEPTTWEEVNAYANTDDPNARRLAAMAVMRDPQAPEQTKQAYFNHWAQLDPAGATLYNQQATMSAAEQRLADLEARLEAKYAATQEDLLTRNATDLMEAAKAGVPGFVDHANGVLALWNERTQNEPTFAERFLAAPRADQLRELRRLTIIAAAEAEPARKAAQAAATQDTDAAKQRARTETSRTSGQPDTEQSAAKRKSLEDARRVGSKVF